MFSGFPNSMEPNAMLYDQIGSGKSTAKTEVHIGLLTSGAIVQDKRQGRCRTSQQRAPKIMVSIILRAPKIMVSIIFGGPYVTLTRGIPIKK
jgi:hypothetical protein